MEHYFSAKPRSKDRQQTISYSVTEMNFFFLTSSSVFSRTRVDLGTDLLIRECRVENPKLLDFGCGYGAIGVVLSRLYPQAKITMCDVNERALLLAKKNLLINDAKARLVKSNLFERLPEKFDSILTNPPHMAGKKLIFKMIEQSYGHLNKGGSLQLVAMNKKGGKDLAHRMHEVFGNVQVIGRQSGYKLYYSTKLL